MSKYRRILLALGDPLLQAQVAAVRGLEFLAPPCESVADCLRLIAASSPDAVVLAPPLAPWQGGLPACIREMRSHHPGVAIAVAGDAGHFAPADFSELQRMGVALLPISSVRTAVEEWVSGHQSPSPATLPLEQPRRPAVVAEPAQPWRGGQPRVLRQKVVAFWGGKPGGGRSTLLVGVADVISRIPGVRVCTVDLNPVNSSLAALLKLEGEPNSWLALSEAQPLSSQAVRAGLRRVNDQWSLITGPAGSSQWCDLLTSEMVTDLVDYLRQDFDFVLLDLPAGGMPISQIGLAQAQEVMVVVSAFFPDVADTTRVLERAVADGLLIRDRCRLVLSQWAESSELPSKDVSNCLGLPVAARVPVAFTAALTAARTGTPITRLGAAEANAAAEGISAVARLIAAEAAASTQRRGWFGR